MRRLRIILPILLLLGAVCTLVSAQDATTPIAANNVAQLSTIASWDVPQDACIHFSDDWRLMSMMAGN